MRAVRLKVLLGRSGLLSLEGHPGEMLAIEALFRDDVPALQALGGCGVFDVGLGGKLPRNNRPSRGGYKEEDLRISSDLRSRRRLLRNNKPMQRILISLDPLRRGPQPGHTNSSDGLTSAKPFIATNSQAAREPTGGLLAMRGGCVIRIKHTPTDREPARPAKDFLHGRPRWFEIATRPPAPGKRKRSFLSSPRSGFVHSSSVNGIRRRARFVATPTNPEPGLT
jgi:hypothetical protein